MLADLRRRRRCRTLVDQLVSDTPADPRALVDAVAARRGRAIELVPVAGSVPGPCGLLISTDRADYIHYPADTTALHQRHILFHELGHLLCEGCGPERLDDVAPDLLAPSLSPELVRRVLGRTVYSEPQEREVEIFASLLGQRWDSLATPHASAGPSSGFDVLFGGRNTSGG